MGTNSGQPATQINTSGDFQVQGDREFIYWFGTLPQINSSGSFTKASGTGTANVNVALSNSGATSIVSGSLRLANGGTSSGSFSVPAGTTIDFGGGTHSLSTTSSIAGDGTGRFSGGTVSHSGSYLLPSTLVTGGTFNANGPFDTDTINITGGALNLATNDSVSTVSHSNGTLGGAGTLSVSGSYTWSGGTMQSPGVTHIEPTATLSISGISDKLLLRKLNIDGDATFSAGRILMGTNTGQPATQINTSGDFQVQGDREFIYWFGTLPQVNSSGSFTKASGTGVTGDDI